LRWLHCSYSTIELHLGNHLIQAPRQFIDWNSWLDNSGLDNSRLDNSCGGIRSGCGGTSLRHALRRRGWLLYIWPCTCTCSYSADYLTPSWCCPSTLTDDVLHRLRCCRRCPRCSATNGIVLSARELSGHAEPPDYSRESALKLRLGASQYIVVPKTMDTSTYLLRLLCSCGDMVSSLRETSNSGVALAVLIWRIEAARHWHYVGSSWRGKKVGNSTWLTRCHVDGGRWLPIHLHGVRSGW